MQELIIALTSGLINLCADTPDESEDESIVHDVFSVAWDLALFFVGLGLPVADKSVKDLEHIIDDEVRASGHRELAVPVDVSTSDVCNVVH